MVMAWLLTVIAAASNAPSPVHVEVSLVSSHFATVSWDLPRNSGAISGFVISQERREGRWRRVIAEVNTTERTCVLWGLLPDSEYTVRVSALSREGPGPPSEPVSFRTPGHGSRPHAASNDTTRTYRGDEARRSDGTSPSLGLALFSRDLAGRTMDERAARGDVNVKKLARRTPELMAGELFIISIVLLMWAAVIGLFCRQYDLIKDNDLARTYRDKQASVEAPLLAPPQPPPQPPPPPRSAALESLHGKHVPVAPVFSADEV